MNLDREKRVAKAWLIGQVVVAFILVIIVVALIITKGTRIYLLLLAPYAPISLAIQKKYMKRLREIEQDELNPSSTSDS